LDVSGCSNPDELKRMLEELLMVRRFKKDVLEKVLPKKHRQLVYIEACPRILKDIAELQEKRRNIEITLRDPNLESNVAEALSRVRAFQFHLNRV
jgi:hypothetical protein